MLVAFLGASGQTSQSYLPTPFRQARYYRNESPSPFRQIIQESPRQTKSKKGRKRKVHEFRPFLCEFWCFPLGEQARFTLNFCSGMPLGKAHELAFLWFGLPGPLLNYFSAFSSSSKSVTEISWENSFLRPKQCFIDSEPIQANFSLSNSEPSQVKQVTNLVASYATVFI